jgi:diketogulonate reductase-like aldo/keto reductase
MLIGWEVRFKNASAYQVIVKWKIKKKIHSLVAKSNLKTHDKCMSILYLKSSNLKLAEHINIANLDRLG